MQGGDNDDEKEGDCARSSFSKEAIGMGMGTGMGSGTKTGIGTIIIAGGIGIPSVAAIAAVDDSRKLKLFSRFSGK